MSFGHATSVRPQGFSAVISAISSFRPKCNGKTVWFRPKFALLVSFSWPSSDRKTTKTKPKELISADRHLSTKICLPAVIPVPAKIGKSLSMAFRFQQKGKKPFRSYTTRDDDDDAAHPLSTHLEVLLIGNWNESSF